jgi:hypothetical protein
MVPVPSLLGCIFHGVWVVVFSSIVPHFHGFHGCNGPGRHYVVITAGLLAVFALSFIAEIALTVIGCRGE